jgi:epoxyqueuosine reductase
MAGVTTPAFFCARGRLADNVFMSTFSDKIRQKALELGFAKAGIVRAQALDGEGEHLREWLDLGFNGQMAWMAREPDKRSDPRLLFPQAKSIVVVALNYYTENNHDDAELGKISRYAWGDDYHEVLREKLGLLLDWIKAQVPAAEGKLCIDTAPFMDKAWAARAGVGWIGKNTNLITTEIGSWVFIGSLILNIELDYDTAIVEDHCGTCTACLDACPTGAIVEPYVVDSRKCISYATIELRDEKLPDEIASNLNGWIYGCDICQDVCPWNRFETSAAENRFEPRLGETSLDLERVRLMEHDAYVERFRGSAMKRTKLAGLKRNAAALKQCSSR